jgi:hypothetical protein
MTGVRDAWSRGDHFLMLTFIFQALVSLMLGPGPLVVGRGKWVDPRWSCHQSSSQCNLHPPFFLSSLNKRPAKLVQPKKRGQLDLDKV